VSGLEFDGELRLGPMLRPDVSSSASTVATSVHCCTCEVTSWCGPLLSWQVGSVVRCTAGPNLVRAVKPVRRSRHWRPMWRTLLLCAGQLGAVRSTPHRTWCGWKKPMRRYCHEPATFRR
jgi:hypothetical protein